MIYTDSGKYAIRAITYMAGREDLEQPVPAAEIAAAEEIPPYYLAKVLQDLAGAGILDSVRGRGGGFRLRRPPDEIEVFELLEAVENVRRLTKECILGLDECNDQVSCPLHSMWKRVRETLLERLHGMYVSDLVLELERKRRYLGVRRPDEPVEAKDEEGAGDDAEPAKAGRKSAAKH